MDKFLINGGKKLSGTAEITAAKNAYLPILAACILCDDNITLCQCPEYVDIVNMTKILKNLGAKVKPETTDGKIHNNCNLNIDCSNLSSSSIPQELASSLRSSIFSLGSILGKQRKAKVAYPGGCAIGARPIDLHIKGLRALNVKVVDKHGYLTCDGSNMKGGIVNLDFPSVGATENIILAATKTKGTTKIINAAKEPEIVDLANFLNKFGAKIYGAGTSTITIEGVEKLGGGAYTPIPDRIVAGTYLIAALAAGGEVELRNFRPEHNLALLEKIKQTNAKVKIKKNTLFLKTENRPKAISKIETSPYPGFPTDLQAQMVALQSISKGTSIIVENLFETRFKHVPELVKMGANIVVKDRTAFVRGVEKLYGANVEAADLRGGVALAIAGLVAGGHTTISNVNLIDRGYFKLENAFAGLGADIKRISD